jgi:hypothetical protein
VLLCDESDGDVVTMFAGMRSSLLTLDSGGGGMAVGPKPLSPAPVECVGGNSVGPFSSREVLSNIVSPGACIGSSRGAGIRWRAPKPSVQPNSPWPPQLGEGVMVTGRVMLYSRL